MTSPDTPDKSMDYAIHPLPTAESRLIGLSKLMILETCVSRMINAIEEDHLTSITDDSAFSRTFREVMPIKNREALDRLVADITIREWLFPASIISVMGLPTRALLSCMGIFILLSAVLASRMACSAV